MPATITHRDCTFCYNFGFSLCAPRTPSYSQLEQRARRRKAVHRDSHSKRDARFNRTLQADSSTDGTNACQLRCAPIEEKFRRNAGRVMQEIIRQRLQSGGTELVQQKNSRYAWGDGVILNRNSRVGDLFWTNLPPAQINDLMQVASEKPAVFLFCFFDMEDKKIDCWAFTRQVGLSVIRYDNGKPIRPKNIVIDRGTNRLRNAGDSPDLTPHFHAVSLTPEEVNAIAAAIKQDAASKEVIADDEEGEDDPVLDLDYSQATVDYVLGPLRPHE